MGTRAVQVESLLTGIYGDDNLPLSGGKVYTYAKGTTTAKATYTSADKSTEASNPIILNAEGRALVFADGLYKFVIKNASDVEISGSPFDDLTFLVDYVGSEVDARGYGDGSLTSATLNTAITAIGSSNVTMRLVSGTWAITANVTFPSNIHVRFERGAVLNVSTGITVTLGLFDAPKSQIFSGAGTLAFSSSRETLYPQYWGALADGSTDDTSAIQKCLNAAAAYKQTRVHIPQGHYKFSKLYLYYDASLNPGWPQTAGLQGKLQIEGDGETSGYNYLNNVWTGTVLESTDATGPAIKADGSSVGARMSNLEISKMSIIATNTTQVLDIDIGNYGFNLKNLLIGQKGAGDGILHEAGYSNLWTDVLIYGAGKTVSGKGLVVRTLSSQSGGGNHVFIRVATNSFDKGWELGHDTYGSGATIMTIDCIGCEASTHKTHGVLIGHGAKNVNWLGSYIEACQDGASAGIGMVIKNRAQQTRLAGSWWSSNDIGISLGTDDADTNIGGIDGVTVEDCYINNILVTGIQVWANANSVNKEILHCKFTESASAPGATTGIAIEDEAQRGLRVEDNEFDTNINTFITNAARIDVFVKYDSTNGSSIQKRGNFVSFTSLDATPDVSGGSLFKTANAGATTITMFDGGITTQEILILFNDANTTIDFTGTNLKGNAGADFTGSVGDTMSCVFDGTNWYCAVSNNT